MPIVASEKKQVTGLVVKGYFQRGEKWVFVPNDVNQEVVCSRFLEDITKVLWKQSENDRFNLFYNVMPEATQIEDTGALGVRLLQEDEIFYFTKAFFEAKNYHNQRGLSAT